jgi:hypothetical protein
MTYRFSVVILTGGPARPEMTARSIQSINTQSFGSIQRILINNGRSKEELEEIEAIWGIESNLKDWEILEVGKNSYNPDDLTSLWGIPGEGIMDSLLGEFTFIQNDDDFLSKDFFERIDGHFNKYPQALTAFGLAIDWNWETLTSKEPECGNWVSRPLIENGQELFTKVYSGKNSSYNLNPGFSYVCRTDFVKQAGANFFRGGAPDYPSLMQIVPAGDTIFDSEARMFLGRHASQQRHEWQQRQAVEGIYYRGHEDFKRNNLAGAAKTQTLTKENRASIIRYFDECMVDASIDSLLFIFQNRKSLKQSEVSLPKMILKHLGIARKKPIFAIGKFWMHVHSFITTRLSRLFRISH